MFFWWYPPQPPLITLQPPRPSNFFALHLLLWMQRKLWGVKLFCPHPTCDKKELTGAGIYPRVRQVLDIDERYNLAAEYLECNACKRKVISWSPAIVRQLDPGHQLKFPVLITYQYACDVKVIRLLRQRSLGNSSTLQYTRDQDHTTIQDCTTSVQDLSTFPQVCAWSNVQRCLLGQSLKGIQIAVQAHHPTIDKSKTCDNSEAQFAQKCGHR